MMMYNKYKRVAETAQIQLDAARFFIDWPGTRIKIESYVMKRKLRGICYTNSACSLWRKSSSRGYALILREMLYDMPLCPENQGRFITSRNLNECDYN